MKKIIVGSIVIITVIFLVLLLALKLGLKTLNSRMNDSSSLNETKTLSSSSSKNAMAKRSSTVVDAQKLPTQQRAAIILITADPLITGGLTYSEQITQNGDNHVTLTYGVTGADASRQMFSGSLAAGGGAYNYNAFTRNGDTVTIYNTPVVNDEFIKGQQPESEIRAGDFHDGGVKETFSLQQAYQQLVNKGDGDKIKQVANYIKLDDTAVKLADEYSVSELEAARVALTDPDFSRMIIGTNGDENSPIYVQSHRQGERIFDNAGASDVTYPTDMVSLSTSREVAAGPGTIWYTANHDAVASVNIFRDGALGVAVGPGVDAEKRASQQFSESTRQQFAKPYLTIQLPVYSKSVLAPIIDRLVMVR